MTSAFEHKILKENVQAIYLKNDAPPGSPMTKSKSKQNEDLKSGPVKVLSNI